VTHALARDLDVETRELAQRLLARLGMTSGRGRVELETNERGELVALWTHSKYAAAELVAFDFPPPPPEGS
jgi:hypothetical protein